MSEFERNRLKNQLAKEEIFWDSVIDISPFFLAFLLFLFQQVVYDLLFCLQEPLPEYPNLFHIRRVSAFTRQTLINTPYMVALFGLLLPNSSKVELAASRTVSDYGPSRQKLHYWLILVISIILICAIPVLRINDSNIAWIYRISFLAGALFLVVMEYAVIRIAFRNKINQTHSPTQRNFTSLLTVCAILTVALTVIIHRMIIP